MINNLISFLQDADELLGGSAALLALLCIMTVLFVICALFGGGEFIRIKRGFKKLYKAVSAAGDDAGKRSEIIDRAMSAMPPRIAVLYEKSVALGALPGEFVTSEACVFVPYFGSALRSLPKASLTAAAIADVMYAAFNGAINAASAPMWAGILIITLLGVVFFALGAVISRCQYRGAIKIYSRAIEAADAAAVNKFRSDLPETDFSDAKVELDSAFSSDEADAATVEEIKYDEGFSSVTEPADYETYDDYSPSVSVSDAPFEPETEDVVARVEHISVYGSTIDEMKEVAALLKLERAKPENRTPAKKKKLDDAFAALLRSVSSATKKRD